MARIIAQEGADELSERESLLVEAIQCGFPLVSRPFDEIGARCGMSGAEVLAMLADFQARGVVKRMGVIVRHHELGYRANAMVVWDIPDREVGEIGQRIRQHPFVTLCYRRRRSPPRWRYNLYCMIHGRQREEVLAKVEALVTGCGLTEVPREVLFSSRRFKQRGAFYRLEEMRDG